ncbi:MAG: DEAD/DEAH box helicase [Phycisphaerae bacterium]|nr:DEAD/DEAH box helicase [Phycisphaerae bacterium]
MQKHTILPQPFADLGVEVRFLKALERMGFATPTDVQKVLIPLILEGKDVLGQARTGTGKTAAFALPLLQRCDPAGSLQMLCLTPTRELAVQVCDEIRRLAQFADLRGVPVYGGQRISTQVHYLGRKPHFVVGTPGRVFDFLQRKVLKFDTLRAVVLDEVDRMLDIGFRDAIRDILTHVRQPHQTIFVSATVEHEIRRLTQQFATDAVAVDISRDEIVVDEVEQFCCSVDARDKFRLLKTVLKEEDPELTIIFTNTKAGAHKLARRLHEIGISAKELHGDLMQKRRERIMGSFRKHRFKVLVATDLVSRGIDVQAITHIINYDLPQDTEAYVHRIGRTARMGACGKAITFVTPDQGKELTQIEKLINVLIEEKKYPGFVPRVFEEDRPPQPEAAATPRYQQAVFSDRGPAGEAPRSAPTKTLGSKFRPRRRRRL